MTNEPAWVRLQSGRRLDSLQPNPASWTDSDLAIGLSRTYRRGGYSSWDLPLSVAQHSLLVLVLRQKMAPLDNLTRGEALAKVSRRRSRPPDVPAIQTDPCTASRFRSRASR